MSYKIDRLDDFGRGITFVNDKICFVNNALIDEEVELGQNDLNNVTVPELSGKTILSATLIYNDDLYYATITDGRQLAVAVRSTGVITVLQKGGTRNTNRTIIIRVHYT